MTTTKRTIQNPDKWIGKHVSPRKWIIPEGYQLCTITGKLHPESQLTTSFAHYVFDKQWLIEKGIYVEDADWLSDEGYDYVMDVLQHEDQYSKYIER